MEIKKEDLKKAMEIKSFLEENYRENPNYDFISNKFGMNKFKLTHSFKMVAKDNIHSFITKLRIKKAKELLENTGETIEYIASQLGLNKSNLHIQFKKVTGKTPAKWRAEFNSRHSAFSEKT